MAKKPKHLRIPIAPDGRDYVTAELLCVELAMQCPLGKLPLKCLVDMVHAEAYRYAQHLKRAGHPEGDVLLFALLGNRWHPTISGIIGSRMRKGLPRG